MPLKVLLADESTSIKKAFQLALSDYGVEVKSVPSGLDVLSVSLDFKPDIIFADVLLTKKSGYEVCKEVKSHPALSPIPFILMWSHFMEFDSSLATQAGFTDKIEKPFDTETLRQKVNTYVAKTKAHPLNGMLEFPEMPNFIESDSIVRQRKNYLEEKTEATYVDTHESTQKIELAEIEETDEQFAPVQLKHEIKQKTPPEHKQELKNDHQFTHSKTVQKPAADPFEIQIETENYGDFEEVVLVKSDKAGNLQNRIQEQIQTYLENSPVAMTKSDQLQNQRSASDTTYSSTDYDEQLMREEVRLMAEKICWQIIPDITEKIVREEISKLLSNIDKSI
jgi:two-component system cell cycle response regulator